MRHYFLDTSALVKAYAWEEGSRRVRDTFRGSTHSTCRNLGKNLHIQNGILMFPKRQKRPSIRHTRLRFGRRAPQPVATPLVLAPRQTFDTMDLSEYDEDLIEAKRRVEADGGHLWIPKRGATIELPDPIDFGVSLSDIVIRNRGREP